MENIIYIKQLLERFYNGQTTLDEENDLKMFFSDCQNIPKELEADKTLFNIIKSTEISILNSIDVPGHIETDIEASIDNYIQISRQKPTLNWKKISFYATACACLIALLIPYIFNDCKKDSIETYNSKYSNVYIPQSEEAATAEATRALILVSSKLNQSSEKIELTTNDINNF